MNDPDVGVAGSTDLLRRVAAGRAGAWDDLIRRYTPLVRGCTARYRLQEADALDVAQVTWLRLAENLHRIHTPAHLAGWLTTVSSRECLRVVREHRRSVLADDAVAGTVDPTPGPEDRAVGHDVRTALRSALAGLPPGRRRLLTALFDGDRRPYVVIARELDIPVGSIGPTRARSLAELRRVLAHAGIAAAA